MILGKVYPIVFDWLWLDVHGGINFIPWGYKIVQRDMTGGVIPVLPPTVYGFGPRLGAALEIRF